MIKLIKILGKNSNGNRQKGFTLIETLVVVTLSALLFIGFRYTFVVFSEQLNRSWSQRYLEQYGNSVIEYVARNIINARAITIGASQGSFGTFYATVTDPFTGNYQVMYSSSDQGVKENNQSIFSEYPLEISDNSAKSIFGPREEVEIQEFRGEFVYRPEPPYNNATSFIGRVFKITLKIKYTRLGDKDFDDYIRIMTFTGQVSMKMRDTSLVGATIM
jgi:prepilin-type N-terminal cleavage/methylation domain-containing protein